jgi:hypothetical protein
MMKISLLNDTHQKKEQKKYGFKADYEGDSTKATSYSTKIQIIQQKYDLFNKFRKEFNKNAFPSLENTPSLTGGFIQRKWESYGFPCSPISLYCRM